MCSTMQSNNRGGFQIVHFSTRQSLLNKGWQDANVPQAIAWTPLTYPLSSSNCLHSLRDHFIIDYFGFPVKAESSLLLTSSYVPTVCDCVLLKVSLCCAFYLLQPGLWAAVGQLLRGEDLCSRRAREKARNSVGLGPCIHL